MAIKGIVQPNILEINEKLRLRKFETGRWNKCSSL